MAALPDLSIRQFEYLVAVAEADTFAAAAKHVGVSPSALSQGLAELERRVGVALFDWQGRRRVLRPDAQPVLDHARQVVALTTDLMGWAERLRTGDEGRLRLGMIDAAAVHYYHEVLTRFRSDHPDLRLLLRVAPSADLFDELRSGTLDLVVCVEPPVPLRGVLTFPLLHEDLGVYTMDSRKQVGPPALWGPWVLFPKRSHTRAITEAALRSFGAPVEVVAESHHPEVLRKMVRLGLGWTVLPVVQAQPGGPTDRPLVRARKLVRRQIVTAHRHGSVLNPAARRLETALRLSNPSVTPKDIK